MSDQAIKCANCGLLKSQLLMFAALAVLDCSVPDVACCPDGGKHTWEAIPNQF